MKVLEHDLTDERPIPLGRAAVRESSADQQSAASRTVRVKAEAVAAEVTPLDGHPLASFRRFRMEVEVVEPVFGRERGCLGRLILGNALALALVLALVVAFVACAGHGGRAPA